MKRFLNLVIAFVTLASATGALAQTTNAAFTAGNLVIYRVGDGSTTLTNTGSRVFLDEYTTNGVLVNVVVMPTNYFGAFSPLIASGTAIAEGLISRSADGRFIVLTGYGATLGQVTNTPLPGTSSTTVPRVVGLVDGAGHIDTTTVQTNTFSDIEAHRSAASTDGTNLWFSGESSGIRYTMRGNATATQLSSLLVNVRQLNIFSNQLYFSTQSSPPIRIGTAGPGLPTTSGQSYTNLPGFATASGSPYAFALFKVSGGADPFDTLYVADDTGGAVYKWSLVGGSWVSNGFVQVTFARGVTGNVQIDVPTTNVHLYITGSGSLTDGSLNKFTDATGFGGNPGGGFATFLLNAGVNKNFRGIAFAPVGSEPFPSGPGQISVGPILGLVSSGFQGGPFSPSNLTYSVANPGTAAVTWSATNDANWVTLTPTNGTLAAGDSTNVILSLNANASALAGGTNYLSTTTFTNTTPGNVLGTTTRLNRLTVLSLAVSPSTNFNASGPIGGPFTTNFVYTLTNAATLAQSWSVSKTASWVDLSATSGTLGGNTSTNITVSINSTANSFSRGPFVDTLSFTNVTLNTLVTTRRVSLQVGIGFYDDFCTTFTPGNLVGQQGWYEGFVGPQPIQISACKAWNTPGFANGTHNQDVAKDFGFVRVTNTTLFAGMVLTVTNAAPSNTGTPSYFVGLDGFQGDNGGFTPNFRNYRILARAGDTGNTNYVLGCRANGFSDVVYGTTKLDYGTPYIMITQPQLDATNMSVYVSPTSPVLGAQTPYMTNRTTSTSSITSAGAVVINQVFGNDGNLAGVGIGKVSISTNFAQVYDELVVGAYADFTASPTIGLAPLTVNFTNRSSGLPSVWAWDFGDLSSSTATNPSHPYAAGTYTVRLIVTGPTGFSTNTQVNLIRALTPLESWQTFYFGSTGNPNGAPNVDPDGDGMSNTNEFQAGFSPTNSAAYLHVISIAKTNTTDINVIYRGANGDSTWSPGVACRTNVLEFTPGVPPSGSYSNNFETTGQTNILCGGTGTGVTTNMVDTGGATNVPARYYRIRVLVP